MFHTGGWEWVNLSFHTTKQRAARAAEAVAEIQRRVVGHHVKSPIWEHGSTLSQSHKLNASRVPLGAHPDREGLAQIDKKLFK